MPAGKRISLGAAFFGCDPAESYYSPGQQVPDARLLSLADYEGVLSGVFSSCRAGRHWVLASARTAALTLDMGSAQADEQAWHKRLSVLQSDLSTRAQQQGDAQGASLYLLCSREQSTTPAFQLLPGMLAAAGGAVDMLFIKTPRGSDAPESDVLSAFLREAAPGLGNVHVLCVQCGHCILPPPALLPSLKLLTVNLKPGTAESTKAEVLGSIRPYLGQLTDLTVGLGGPVGLVPDSFPWHLLFPPVTAATATAAAPAAGATATGAAAASTATASPAAAITTTAAASTVTPVAPKLTEFSTTYDLTDTLLTTLLHHAPNIAELGVGRIALRGDYSSRKWSVGTLHVWFGVWDSGLVRLYEGMYMPTLVRLPVCNHHEPVVVGGFEQLKLFATSDEGLDESVADRLCTFTFDVSGVGIYCDPSLSLADQPAAFKSTLQQLSEFSMADGLVVTRGWHWTVDMLRIAAEYVPTLEHLRIQMDVSCQEPLTDEHLSLAMQLSDHQLAGAFERLSLQSDQHSNATWPFQRLHIMTTVNAADLVKLPRPDESSKAVMWCHRLLIDSRSITEVGVERLRAWLQHVTWTHPNISYYGQHMYVVLRCPQDDPAMQRAQLQVLRAIHLDAERNVQARVDVVLEGWQMTHTAMDVLREGLPEWGSQLDLFKTRFILRPSQYTRFAQCVPVTYTTWYTNLLLGSKTLDSVAKGINARRKGLGLPRVRLTSPDAVSSDTPCSKTGKHYEVGLRSVDSEEWEFQFFD